MTEQSQEQLLYLMDFLDMQIEKAIYDVLSDSEEDPQSSAVTTQNLIKCYINIMQEIGKETRYSDIEGYMRYNCFSDAEITMFHQKAERESKYYIGVRY